MLQYDLARLQMRDVETAAARARVSRELRESHQRRPLRAALGHRLVRIGLRLAPA